MTKVSLEIPDELLEDLNEHVGENKKYVNQSEAIRALPSGSEISGARPARVSGSDVVGIDRVDGTRRPLVCR